LRVQTATLITSFGFLAVSIYFAVLSFKIIDLPSKEQIMALSTAFFVGGIVLLICWVSAFTLKKVLFRN